ncbi:hypothetical protein [Flavobacterium supellecticarium]|nr:hypothetical protein [Flavobacterium supellecticarium]
MKTKFLNQLIFLILIGTGLTNCTDPYKIKTEICTKLTRLLP